MSRQRLNRALLEVGVEMGYGYILNTDNNNCPYINPVVGVDVTNLVRKKLGLAYTEEPSPVAAPEAAPAAAPEAEAAKTE